jgi:hypothetical protein
LVSCLQGDGDSPRSRTHPTRTLPEFADFRPLGKSIRMGHLLESHHQHTFASLISAGSLQDKSSGITLGGSSNSLTLNDVSPSAARYLQQQETRRWNHKLGSLSGPMADPSAMQRYQ